MKQQLSSLGLYYITQELQSYVGHRIDKIFQPQKNTLLLQLHSSKEGKALIHCDKKFVYPTQYKTTQDSSSKIFPFCKTLRNNLTNGTVTDIRQHKFERIITFTIQKETTHYLICELFDKGNIILCDADFKIKNVLEKQFWKSRELVPQQQYEYVEKDIAATTCVENEFQNGLRGTDKESVVLFLAIELGFGGIYAEEICKRAGVEKRIAPEKITGPETKQLFTAMKALFDQEQDVSVYINPTYQQIIDASEVASLQDLFSITRSQLEASQNDPEQAINLYSLLELIKEVTPFSLETYSDMKRIGSEYSFGVSLASLFYVMTVQEKVFSVLKDKKKTLERLGRIVKNQRQQIKGYEREYDESQKKGTLLYEHYAMVKQLLDDIKTYSLERIEENLSDVKKQYPFLLSASPQKRQIQLELDEQ